jgi:hypothetical protein
MGENRTRPPAPLPKTNSVCQIKYWLVHLVTEHTAHFFGVFPFLIFLACPLMHLFMHHGHGGHGKDDGPSRTPGGSP